MVVAATLVPAEHRPVADITERDRLRIIRGSDLAGSETDYRDHLPTHKPDVRSVFVGTETLDRPLWIRRHDAKPLWSEALHMREQLRVQAELNDRPRVRLARQLGVGDLVGPITQRAGACGPLEQVGAAKPWRRSQRTLHDHVYAGAHGLLGRTQRIFVLPEMAEIGDAEPAITQAFHVRLLMVDAALLDDLQDRVIAIHALSRARGDLHIQGCPMPAAKEVGEVGRGDGQTPGS